MRWKQFLTPVKSMDAAEAKAYMDAHEEGSYTLLDVRQPAEYEEAHLPGAKRIPLPDLQERLDELDRRLPVIAY
jgi:rhodanese-related sulfurtransferase